MIYAFGEYRLDTETFGLTRLDEAVHVDPQEFDLLLYLIEHRDRVVTRRELLDVLWAGRYVTDSALSSRLKAVRKAVGDSGSAQRVIQTVHGRGYRFVAPVSSTASPPVTAPGSPTPLAGLGDAAPAAADAWIAGRAPELAELSSILDRASAGASQVVFVSGEMGIGKTTLIERFAAAASARRGAAVLHGQCLSESSAAEPYLPLLDAIGRAARSSLGGALVDALRRCAPTLLAHFPHVLPAGSAAPASGEVAPAANERRLLLELCGALNDLATRTPLVLLLEDVQWADPSTLAWLDYMARRADPVPLMVVSTLRTGSGREAPGRLVSELTVRGLARRIELDPLDAPAIHDYLSTRLGREPDADTVAALRRYCSGQPLYMRLVVDGWLQATGGDVALDAHLETIPGSLRELVDVGLSALDDRSVALFECAAVAGVEFSAPLVAAALEDDDDVVEERLVTLSRTVGHPLVAGEIDWPDGTITTRFRFGHHFYAQAIYDRQPVGLRRKRHRAIARRLEAAWAGRIAAHGVELAHHFECAGEWTGAVEAYRLAAGYAAERGANREAADLLRRALRLVHHLPDAADRDAVELSLLVSLGTALFSTQGYAAPEATRTYARAREVGHRLGRGAHLLPVLYGSWNNALVAGRIATARGIGVEFVELARAEADDALSVALRAVAWPDLLSGRFREAREGFLQAMEHARSLGTTSWVDRYGEHPYVAAESASAWASWFLGDTTTALASATSGVRRAKEIGHPFTLAYAYAAESVVLQLLGELEALDESTRLAIESATEHEIPLFRAWGHGLRGWLLCRRGELDAGLGLLHQGLRDYQQTGAQLFSSYFTGLLVDGLGRAGRIDEALEAVADGLRLVEENGEHMVAAELHRCRGVVLLARDPRDVADALQAFREASDTSTRLGSPTLGLRAVLSWVKVEAEADRGRPSSDAMSALRGCLEGFPADARSRDLDAARAWLSGAGAASARDAAPGAAPSRRRPQRRST